MFFYLPVPMKSLDIIRQEGIDTKKLRALPLSSVVPPNVSNNQTAFLVIDAAQIGNNENAQHIPPSAICNITPYMPPRRVIAAGGYVMRQGEKGRELLVMFRRGVWDLPKGKQDPGESNEETAIREVQEEIGIQHVRIVCSLGDTFHGYPHRKGKCYDIKTTHWYLMTTNDVHFTPQQEEDIEELRWIPLEDAPQLLGYESLKSHISLYYNNLAKADISE